MSMDRCSKCSNLVDTDEDPEFYGETGDGPNLCEACREEEAHELDEVMRADELLGKIALFVALFVLPSLGDWLTRS